METKKELYKVLSIRELRKILKKAREESKDFYKGKVENKYTIVLRFELSEEFPKQLINTKKTEQNYF